jgi:hypothetical protein
MVDVAWNVGFRNRALSIKTTTYNADPYLGEVNWDENVTGVNSTKDMYPRPRGTGGE